MTKTKKQSKKTWEKEITVNKAVAYHAFKIITEQYPGLLKKENKKMGKALKDCKFPKEHRLLYLKEKMVVGFVLKSILSLCLTKQ